ncbi:putative zinc finger protein 57-like [Penaeus vannamei]|uniref:Putative zinc finger protein 57-like n=1 Tax=Penaeus vannamei TaxID=6689 RepID=A0A3R7LZX3_PENVA|nr:putative zinc finger protein 57-like [Penaeus vannamei]
MVGGRAACLPAARRASAATGAQPGVEMWAGHASGGERRHSARPTAIEGRGGVWAGSRLSGSRAWWKWPCWLRHEAPAPAGAAVTCRGEWCGVVRLREPPPLRPPARPRSSSATSAGRASSGRATCSCTCAATRARSRTRARAAPTAPRSAPTSPSTCASTRARSRTRVRTATTAPPTRRPSRTTSCCTTGAPSRRAAPPRQHCRTRGRTAPAGGPRAATERDCESWRRGRRRRASEAALARGRKPEGRRCTVGKPSVNAACRPSRSSLPCCLCRALTLLSVAGRGARRGGLGGGRLVCPLCPRSFASAAELGRHTAAAHRLDKLYWCQQCHYRSDSKSNLLRHLRTHTGEKRHACPVCPYRAGQRSDLRRHLRVHALRRAHNALQCRLCDFTTPTPVAFALHILEAHSKGGAHDPLQDDT